MKLKHQGSGWIWLPNWSLEGEDRPVFVYFRRTLSLETVPEQFFIHISADSRYKLYLNRELVEVGPAKGDDKVWYYDRVDTAPYLRQGENVWAVVVLRYPLDCWAGNQSVFRTTVPVLFLESEERDAAGVPAFRTDESWKVRCNPHIRIVSENPFFAPLQIYEEVMADPDTFGWMEADYDSAPWTNAQEYSRAALESSFSPEPLTPRPIHFLEHRPCRFCGITKKSGHIHTVRQWEALLREGRPIYFPPNHREEVDLDAGELTTGYLRLRLADGAQAQIRLLQSECYVERQAESHSSYDALPTKGDRSNTEGKLTGNTDRYTVCGKGTVQRPEQYEPFWFRTFRYIRLTICTAAAPLTILGLDYTEAGYSLNIQTHVETSDPSLAAIWDLSARTLRRCMHETYEDCPFYEQMQYAMDSRSQMLYDHMMYFGDKALISAHLPTVDGILNYFDQNLDERGILRRLGGRERPNQYWSFIDWTPEWNETRGVPPAYLQGGLTMESLLYLLGLQYAEALRNYVGETAAAQAYHSRAEALRGALRG